MKEKLYTAGELNIIFDNDIKDFIRILIYNKENNIKYFNSILIPFYIKKKQLGEIPQYIEEFVEEHKLISPLPFVESEEIDTKINKEKLNYKLSHNNFSETKTTEEEEIKTTNDVNEEKTDIISFIFCQKCGNKNFSSSNYCYKCGTKIFIPDKVINKDRLNQSINDNISVFDLNSTNNRYNGRRVTNVNHDVTDSKLSGCLISFLVYNIVVSIISVGFFLFIPVKISSQLLFVISLIILGILLIVSYVLILKKYKKGLYLNIVVTIIVTIISLVISIEISKLDLRITLLIYLVVYTTFYSLIYKDWKKFR